MYIDKYFIDNKYNFPSFNMFNDKEVGVGDFVLLPQINMENFLENLKVRHASGHIYTYIGESKSKG